MATTVNTGITKLATGQASKEPTINEALDALDSAVAGQLTKSVAGSSNVTLTRTEALNIFYVFTGTLTGNIEVRWPASGGKARFLVVYNATSGAFSLTLTVAGGSGVAITQGQIRTFAIDGTTVRPTDVSAGTYTQQSAQAVWARVFHSAAQSIPNNVSTALNFNSERADTDTIHDNATNNTRLTCKTSGVYSIVAQAGCVFNSTGIRVLEIVLNGVTTIASTTIIANSTTATRLVVPTVYSLAVNDYVEAFLLQNSGGSLNTLQIGNYSPEFMMIRLGGS